MTTYGRDTKVVAMLAPSCRPAIGLLITAMPLIGTGIWSALEARRRHKMADDWSQFRT
jgi:hypothetical protein